MKKKGFTLLEVIIAVFILTTAIIASFSFIQQTIAQSSLNKSKLIAYYLAQEGVENVRNARDTNWLQEEDWDEGIVDSEKSIDNFKRKTIIDDTEIDLLKVLKVKVIVEWEERGINQKIEVISHLYNWYGN